MVNQRIINDLESLVDFYKNHFSKFIEIVTSTPDKQVKLGESFYYFSEDDNRN